MDSDGFGGGQTTDVQGAEERKDIFVTGSVDEKFRKVIGLDSWNLLDRSLQAGCSRHLGAAGYVSEDQVVQRGWDRRRDKYIGGFVVLGGHKRS